MNNNQEIRKKKLSIIKNIGILWILSGKIDDFIYFLKQTVCVDHLIELRYHFLK